MTRVLRDHEQVIMDATSKNAARQSLRDAGGYATDARKLLRFRNVNKWAVARKIKAAMQDLGRALVIVTGDEWWEVEE